MIGLSLYPAKSEKTRWIERKEEAVVLNEGTGIYHKLNKTAACIWYACNGLRNIEEISKLINKEYDTDGINTRKDVSLIISTFKKAGIIELYKSRKNFLPLCGSRNK